jgi:hypothetical protein
LEGHPFVRAAADLCLSALQTGEPSPYLWIDETGTVAKLGQKMTASATTDRAPLWLTESLGWVALKRRTVRLVADAMLMLNLTDGRLADDRIAPQFDRTSRASTPDLPPCMTLPGQRACLGVADYADDHIEKCEEKGCSFHLCPYPPSGKTFRQEFSESFCRHLMTERRAPWQAMRRSELRRFWGDMEKRARIG